MEIKNDDLEELAAAARIRQSQPAAYAGKDDGVSVSGEAQDNWGGCRSWLRK